MYPFLKLTANEFLEKIMRAQSKMTCISEQEIINVPAFLIGKENIKSFFIGKKKPYLVELKNIEELEELLVLLVLAELDVVLLEAVESQLGLVIHEHLHRVLHELLADGPDLLAQGGGEHHHLEG